MISSVAGASGNQENKNTFLTAHTELFFISLVMLLNIIMNLSPLIHKTIMTFQLLP